MNQQEFVQGVLKDQIRDGALEIILKNLAEDPDASNFSFPENLWRSISWYKSLKEEEQHFVLAIAKKAIHSIVFRFLVCLDGADVIDDGFGSLALHYCSEDGIERDLLAGLDSDSLHDIYMEDFPTGFQRTEKSLRCP